MWLKEKCATYGESLWLKRKKMNQHCKHKLKQKNLRCCVKNLYCGAEISAQVSMVTC